MITSVRIAPPAAAHTAMIHTVATLVLMPSSATSPSGATAAGALCSSPSEEDAPSAAALRSTRLESCTAPVLSGCVTAAWAAGNANVSVMIHMISSIIAVFFMLFSFDAQRGRLGESASGVSLFFVVSGGILRSVRGDVDRSRVGGLLLHVEVCRSTAAREYYQRDHDPDDR